MPILKHSHKRDVLLTLRYGSPARYPLLSSIPRQYHNAVLMRFVYSKPANFFYARVPKCANSTVMATLGTHLGVKDDGTINANGLKKRLNSFPTVRQFNNAFRFTIVRDPTTRIISGYLDKIAPNKGEDGEGRLPYVGFMEFLQELEAMDFKRNAHFLPQTSIIPGGTGGMDYVGRVETLQSDLEEICKRVFGSYNGISNETSHQTNAANQKQQFLVPDTVKLIRRLYEADFEVLKYAPPVAS
ncbi:sulfotransferase family protein [Gymnodinialimonas ulvae]|uniref:sulfotransferase family protein n=1 Tax=Gymnodinialimonas ulvae TaxID=3126504 RepID=UPI0030A12B19